MFFFFRSLEHCTVQKLSSETFSGLTQISMIKSFAIIRDASEVDLEGKTETAEAAARGVL